MIRCRCNGLSWIPPLWISPLLVGCCLAVWLAMPASAQSPTPKAKTKPLGVLEVKRLDAKTEEVRQSFLRETTLLIRSYEEGGQFDRARVLLEGLQKLDPQNEPIQNKLGELTEQLLDANEFEIDIDPGKPWQPIGMVTKDRPLRIKVAGEYKLATTLSTGPDGVSSDNPAEDLIANVPLGAVMAVIALPVVAAAPADGNKSKDKQPKPFSVGSHYEKKSDRDGMLYLKVNVPPGSKCTGRLTARISGAIQPQ